MFVSLRLSASTNFHPSGTCFVWIRLQACQIVKSCRSTGAQRSHKEQDKLAKQQETPQSTFKNCYITTLPSKTGQLLINVTILYPCFSMVARWRLQVGSFHGSFWIALCGLLLWRPEVHMILRCEGRGERSLGRGSRLGWCADQVMFSSCQRCCFKTFLRMSFWVKN